MSDNAESEALARRLLDQAQLGELAELRALGEYSNAHYVALADDGSTYVLRRFRDNRPHSPLTRLQRECWASEVLAGRGAPVPLPLARSTTAGMEATLTPLVAGDHLGTIASTLPPADLAAAWSACGRALSIAHSIDGHQTADAGCNAVGIRDSRVSRGPWHHQEALKHLEWLATSRPDLRSCRHLEAAVDAALPLYEDAPLALCQYDAHPWQFLVAGCQRGVWRCTAILDWEHADLDDPDWDLAMLDGFRWSDLGSVPHAFFAGYGRTPTSPLYSLYRLERAAWILANHAEGDNPWLDLSIPSAERLIRGLAAKPRELHERIEKAIASS